VCSIREAANKKNIKLIWPLHSVCGFSILILDQLCCIISCQVLKQNDVEKAKFFAAQARWIKNM